VADAGTEFSGVLMVLSAPLGVGKRTLCQALIDRNPDLRLSISKTTRPARAAGSARVRLLFCDR
jgi:guanylate kinase